MKYTLPIPIFLFTFQLLTSTPSQDARYYAQSGTELWARGFSPSLFPREGEKAQQDRFVTLSNQLLSTPAKISVYWRLPEIPILFLIFLVLLGASMWNVWTRIAAVVIFVPLLWLAAPYRELIPYKIVAMIVGVVVVTYLNTRRKQQCKNKSPSTAS